MLRFWGHEAPSAAAERIGQLTRATLVSRSDSVALMKRLPA